MASFQRRGKTWQYTISHIENGKAKPIRKGGFRTKKEAQVAAMQVEEELNKGILPFLKPILFNVYFEKWFNLYKSNVSNTTKEHYKYTLKYINEYFLNKTLQEITRHDYQQFLNEFGASKAKETVEKLNTHIRGCIQDAIEEGIIRKDFTRKAVLTWTVQAKDENEKHLNFSDSQKLLTALHQRLDNGLGYYLLLLALTSGMRFAELIGLTRKDFYFEKNIICINKTWGYKKSTPTGFGPAKNKSSIRSIKMDKNTMNVFHNLFKTTPSNTNDLVFFSQASKYGVISNTNANKLLRKMLLDINIEPITAHGLRHTHASILLYKKVSIYYVSERLGHQDIETTLKDYTHVIKELRKEDEKSTISTFEDML